MSATRLAVSVLGVLLVLAYAGASALWLENNSAWYIGLKRPWWQPPDVVFGLIWPYNFTALGIALVVVAQRLSYWQMGMAIGLFAVSVATATLWSYSFYSTHQLGPAAAALAITAVLTVPVVVYVFSASTLMGWLLMPYQLWIITAASLSWGYWRLN